MRAQLLNLHGRRVLVRLEGSSWVAYDVTQFCASGAEGVFDVFDIDSKLLCFGRAPEGEQLNSPAAVRLEHLSGHDSGPRYPVLYFKSPDDQTTVDNILKSLAEEIRPPLTPRGKEEGQFLLTFPVRTAHRLRTFLFADHQAALMSLQRVVEDLRYSPDVRVGIAIGCPRSYPRIGKIEISGSRNQTKSVSPSNTLREMGKRLGMAEKVEAFLLAHGRAEQSSNLLRLLVSPAAHLYFEDDNPPITHEREPSYFDLNLDFTSSLVDRLTEVRLTER